MKEEDVVVYIESAKEYVKRSYEQKWSYSEYDLVGAQKSLNKLKSSLEKCLKNKSVSNSIQEISSKTSILNVDIGTLNQVYSNLDAEQENFKIKAENRKLKEQEEAKKNNCTC